MKHFYYILLLMLMLTFTACTQNANELDATATEENIFTATAAQKQKMSALIADTMRANYWRYDTKQISYEKEVLKNHPEKEKIIECGKTLDYDTEMYINQELTVAKTDLLFFNNEPAGTAYVYFTDNPDYKIVGAYYINMVDKLLSLKTRNTYLYDDLFTRFEDTQKTLEYDSFNATMRLLPFTAIKNTENASIISVINENKVMFYQFNRNRFTLVKEYSAGRNLVPFDVMYHPKSDLFFVLLGTKVERDSENESDMQTAQRIVALSNKFSAVSSTAIEEANSASLFLDNDLVGVTCGKNIYYYSVSNQALTKHSQILLDHTALKVSVSKLDLTSPDIFYFMTNGLDFYVYKKQDVTLTLIFKTHLGIESFDLQLYICDRNGDSVNEIYLFDKNKTTIKYIVSPVSFEFSNEDIELGERIFPADFNSDGKMDYLEITDIEDSSVFLHLSK